MTVFNRRMPSGIPGAVSRLTRSDIEPQPLNSALAFVGYGLPGKMASGKFVPLTTGDAATAMYGFLVRSYPTTDLAFPQVPLGSATPPTTGIADVMRKGYMTVKLNGAAAAVDGAPVFVRVAAAAGGKPIGGIEAAADSTNTIQINATFMSPADANGNVEICYNA